MLRRIPVATLFFVIVTTALFYSWSGSFLTSPPPEVPRQYGLVAREPLTYLTYPFVHLWPLHLFANMLFVLAFGSIVESEVGARKLFAFYFVSAAIIGFFSVVSDLVLRNPGTIIVGASGAAFALVGASLVLKPVRTMALFLVLSYFLVPAVLSAGISSAQAQATGEAAAQLNTIEQNKSMLVVRFEAGNITREEFNRTFSEIEDKRQREASRLYGLEDAKARESTPVAEAAHAGAPFVGAMLLLYMRPSELGEWALRGRWVGDKLRRAQKSIYKKERNPAL